MPIRPASTIRSYDSRPPPQPAELYCETCPAGVGRGQRRDESVDWHVVLENTPRVASYAQLFKSSSTVADSEIAPHELPRYQNCWAVPVASSHSTQYATSPALSAAAHLGAYAATTAASAAAAVQLPMSEGGSCI